MSPVWRDSVDLEPLPDGEFAGWRSVSSDVFVMSETAEEAQASIEVAVDKLSFRVTSIRQLWECGTRPPQSFGTWLWWSFEGVEEKKTLRTFKKMYGSKKEALKEFEKEKEHAKRLKAEDEEKERRCVELAKSTGRVVFANPSPLYDLRKTISLYDRPMTMNPVIEDTPGLEAVLSLAKAEAKRLGNELLRPGHYLLGIARRSNCLAAVILVDLGVDLGRLQEAVEQNLTPPKEEAFSTRTAFQSEPAERVMERTGEFASRMGRGYRGTEHLLLALADQEAFGGIGIVRGFGLSYEAIRKKILILYEGPVPDRYRRYPKDWIVNPG